MPFFSIIIPTYNRAELIPFTIQSILEQTFLDYEVIIIDDGSTDNTEEVVRAFVSSRVRYYKQPNKERGAARNFGTAMAKGMYVNFFDSDDMALSNRLALFHTSILEKDFPDFVYSYYSACNSLGEQNHTIVWGDNNPVRRIIDNNFFACGSVFLKKEIALKEFFLEDRALAEAEDWELWLRLVPVCTIYEISQVTYLQREHEGRSLTDLNWEKIKRREERLLYYFQKNSAHLYTKNRNLFIADRFTFIALAYYELKFPQKEIVNNLVKAFIISPKVLIRKRFWAALLKLVK